MSQKSLAPGTRLGVYEVLGQLGAGGMGEVYRARDTRLQREVAIKILPTGLAATPEARARFDREARAISSLNHPNICTLHDIGHEGDVHYLVLELVMGESLADRIARGPLPIEEIVRIGSQIADALEKAHRAGIVHRDLKPGNIMLAKTGAKLLDFGLAQAGAADGATDSGSESLTMSRPITREGTIVGTFQYMAPEQLEGGRMDARTDIWALGCVLYEMATGQRAFQGRSQASLISAIMSQEPASMSQLSPLTPPALERLVKACLAKDPDERVQTAHDVKLQLQWIAEGGSRAGLAAPVAAHRRNRERLAWALAAFAIIVAVWLGVTRFQPGPPRNAVVLELTPPPWATFADLPRISPDGTLTAFNAVDSTGVPSIWVRRMNSLQVWRLPGTERATRPFWSPDNRYLAYFALGKLYKIDIAGGPPLALCDAASGADGSWSPRGSILFDGSIGDSIRVVSAAGGIPTGASRIDHASSETFNAWPHFLPDGKHFLYIAYGRQGDQRTLKIGSIDSKDTKTLGPAASRVEYASGHLLYVRAGTLLAQPFDARALKFTGEPFAVADGIQTDQVGSALFSAASNGTLLYRSGGVGADGRMTWVNRRGEPIGTIGPPGDYVSPALSPDGTRLAVERDASIWVWDLARDHATRLTFEDQQPTDPTWSPDGTRLLYTRAGDRGVELVIKPVDTGEPASILYSSRERKVTYSWSADDRWITFQMRPQGAERGFDIYALALNDPSRPVPIVTGPSQDLHPALSPDSKWLAYTSMESGQNEVYVQPFPGQGGRRQISSGGGRQPLWRKDGRELFYLTPTRVLMSVAVELGPPMRFSLPKKLFNARVLVQPTARNLYLPAPDGQRFFTISPVGEGRVGTTTVVLNWLAMHERGARGINRE